MDETNKPQLRVIIVDDDDDSRDMLAELVRLYGHIPIAANCAAEAMELITPNVPDLGFIDISLADVDGCELIRRIRSRVEGAKIRLVALTGHSDDVTRQQAKLAGCDDYWVKPISLPNLTALFEDACSQTCS
ncbi:MAG TPA: response regulator [Polyangiaceae bacterium]